MNPLNRTVQAIIEHNIDPADVESFLCSNGIKAFQLVKRVTGKRVNCVYDYQIEKLDPWKGYDTIVIKGRKGFMRVALTPLFEII